MTDLDTATTTARLRDDLARVTAERDEMRALNRQLECDVERLGSERDRLAAAALRAFEAAERRLERARYGGDK